MKKEYNCNTCKRSCEVEEDSEVNFCVRCGLYDVSEACPQCGSSIDDDTKYCSECKETVA